MSDLNAVTTSATLVLSTPSDLAPSHNVEQDQAGLRRVEVAVGNLADKLSRILERVCLRLDTLEAKIDAMDDEVNTKLDVIATPVRSQARKEIIGKLEKMSDLAIDALEVVSSLQHRSSLQAEFDHLRAQVRTIAGNACFDYDCLGLDVHNISCGVAASQAHAALQSAKILIIRS